MAKTQIKNYVFKPGIGLNDNLFPNAYSLIEINVEFIKKEATQWIQDQIAAGETDFIGYTFSDSEFETDIENNLQAYLKDLRYSGNENTRNYIKYYWDQDVAQISGNRQPEIQTYNFIDDLIQNYILTNTSYSASNTEVTQTIDTSKTAEADAITKIDTLVQNTVDVIENGLGSLPTLEQSGVGTIKIQGRYDLEDILLITNTTKNEIVYNFSNPATGGSVEFKTDGITEDSDFTKFLQTTDAITIITLNYDTSSHLTTDELQIFIEQTENGKSVVTTRPFDFGTDAIERMRVAQPLSMLDADFEYGLQPTKWAAIGTLRGYPSVYEIPGTDTPVLSVVTDASAGTEGVGQSLITVTTVGPHGLQPGTPITIKALEDSINGAARAEGSFVIVETPSSDTLTYFAKSKVGNTSGDILSTTYTQLRKAGFYTGANIGTPTFSVQSQGSAGTLTAELSILSGSTLIPYDGPVPEIGAPLVNANISTGTQVTGVRSTSDGGGVYVTPTVVGDYNAGETDLTVESSIGILEDLAADRGDGFAIFVNNITGNTLQFSQGFNNPIIGNTTTYNNVTGTNVESFGTDAEFNVSKSNGVYSATIANDGGVGFAVGDRLLITGDQLGGFSPEHDLGIIVTDVVSDGAISTFDLNGTAFDGDDVIRIDNVSAEGGTGSGAEFDIVYEDNEFITVDVSSPDNSTGYIENDVIVIPGDTFTPNGTTPENDLTVKVTATGTGGSITSVAFEGVAPDANVSYINLDYSYTGSGTGLNFAVERDASTYIVIFTDGGTDFLPGETIAIAGTDLGGLSPENDLTITIDNVDSNGAITDFSLSGVARNIDEIAQVDGDNLVGSDAELDITLFEGTYTQVEIFSAGINYATGQQILIPGTDLLGLSPENDLLLTINSVAPNGGITGISITSGVAIQDNRTFEFVSAAVDQPTGTGAQFDILRTDQIYNVTVVDQGSGYKVGNKILIEGTQLGGETPLNDLVIRIVEVEPNGLILDDSTAGINLSYIEAAPGINLDLYSTVTISESTISQIAQGDTIDYELLATLQIDFNNAHGLVPGDTFITTVDSDDGVNNHNLAAGSFFVSDIPSVSSLRYQARAAGTIDVTSDEIEGEVYPRPDSFFIHRPFDGGVQLGTGGPQHGAQAIRQSKKYIRYQSGKGIMYTTGALFAPSYDLRSVTADGVEVNSLITIETDDNDHGVQEGGIIRLLGIETPGYNSGSETAVPPQFDYEVVNVIDERTFQVRSQRRLGATTATLGFSAQMSVVSWHGATVRSGIFDDQNGIFWEFDGTQISVVQRTGTQQIAGTIALQVDNNLVTGTNTRFRDQLKAGDRIIIKGMTHVVSHVNSQTELTVTPDWRGVVDITGAKANLIIDKKVKQENFNLDKLDSTGPSGYKIDIAKMQMIGIQYSWYGAGFIDFMLRGADGNFVYAHRMRNSNVNTEAFMRSGNLPVRYEVTNEGPSSKLSQPINVSDTELILEDASFFPTNGTVYIDNEIITFNGKSGNTLQNLTRGATFTNFQAGADRSYTAGTASTHDTRTGVVLISQTITPLISHWGSAFITDGLFDDDRGYIFSYAETALEVSTSKETAFMIRLAPSVSNALVGDLGERELLNRAQLLLQGLEVTSDGVDGSGNSITGGIVVEGVLNPQNYPENPGSVLWSELSSQAQGGQPSFAQIASGGGIEWTTGAGPSTVSVDWQSNMTSQGISNSFVVDAQGGGRDDRVYFFESDLDAQGLRTRAICQTVPFVGRRIIQINGPFNFGGIEREYEVRFDDRASNEGTNFAAGSLSLQFTFNTETTRSPVAFFTQASWDSANLQAGALIDTTDTNWPANTSVSGIQLFNFGTTNYYEARFNNSSNTTLNGTTPDTVIFAAGESAFAEPGETVFSFIAQPGERATVDFSELKELTNTPLGGRGTYPNGPDVLAINVYKVSGTATNSNLILRWGEAQA